MGVQNCKLSVSESSGKKILTILLSIANQELYMYHTCFSKEDPNGMNLLHSSKVHLPPCAAVFLPVQGMAVVGGLISIAINSVTSYMFTFCSRALR